jgi:outer membrane immunogenic protein
MTSPRFLSRAVLLAGCATLLGLTSVSAGDRGGNDWYSGYENGRSMWDSYYGGFNVGLGFGDAKTTIAGENLLGSLILAAPVTKNVATDGVVVGGQVGVNTRFDRFVYGVELDVDFATLGGNETVSSGNASFKLDRTINALATLRGRIGYLVDPKTLVYGTGGLAIAQADFNVSFNGASPGSTSESTTLRGHTFGAGFEHLFSPRTSFKAEYLYVDLGQRAIPVSNGTSTALFESRVTTTTNVLRAGLNYKF